MLWFYFIIIIFFLVMGVVKLFLKWQNLVTKLVFFFFQETITKLVITFDYNCRVKGPKLYIGPWTLAEDVDWSDDE